MINELYQLASVLEQENITPYKWHDKYKQIPKKDTIRIWLSDTGSVVGIDTIKKEHTQRLRKYEQANGMSFPAFNIIPLYRITDEETITAIQNAKKHPETLDIDQILPFCLENNWNLKTTIEKSICDIPAKLRELLRPEETKTPSVIGQLIQIITNYEKSDLDLRQAIQTYLVNRLRKKEEIDLCLSLLIHCGDAKKSPEKDKGEDFSIILDVDSWEQIGHPISSEQTTKWINDKLKEHETTASQKTECDNQDTDAFGAIFANPDDKMPGVKVGSLGTVILRSLSKEHPCQYRYNEIEDRTYPISKQNREQIKAALEYLAEPEHKGIFWQTIEKDETLFVYPSKLPKEKPQFASLFGGEKNSPSADAKFAAIVKTFTRTLWGLPPKEKPDAIHIFILRKMDKARSKVLFTYNTTPEHLIHSAEEWKRGLENTPPLFTAEKDHIFPLGVADIVNQIWKQNGEDASGKHPVKWMKYQQGIELLLNTGKPDIYQYYLQVLLRNSTGLIKHVGNQTHAKKNCRYKDTKEKCEDICSVIGLLLYKCGHRKENYMNEMPYLIGQLLHIADELHTLYCTVVRKGDIPPQLCGNSLLITAGETPSVAISQLALRMNPYLAWAKKYRHGNIETKGKESWRARWYLNLFEKTSTQLIPVLTEKTRFNDFEKSQLFLGYLASLSETNTTTAGENENDN